MNSSLEKLEELIITGDEAAARTYLTDHINDFPADVRKKFIFALFMEAIENDTQVKSAQTQLIADGLVNLKELQKDYKNIEDKQRIVKVQKDIIGE